MSELRRGVEEDLESKRGAGERQGCRKCLLSGLGLSTQ